MINMSESLGHSGQNRSFAPRRLPRMTDVSPPRRVPSIGRRANHRGASLDTVQKLHDFSDGDVAAWHDVLAASVARDLPGEPVPSLDLVHGDLTTSGLDSRHLLWAARTDGRLTGVARLRLFDGPGRDHQSLFTIDVPPALRRRGVGSRLLVSVARAARRGGRRGGGGGAAAGAPG